MSASVELPPPEVPARPLPPVPARPAPQVQASPALEIENPTENKDPQTIQHEGETLRRLTPI
jgi:hypothetical protein